MRQSHLTEQHPGLFGGPPGGRVSPIDCAPPIVRRHGYCDAHERPLVAKTSGSRISSSFRVSPDKAWAYRYIELNPANSRSVLVFDCDARRSVAEVLRLSGGTSLLPEPNWISWSQTTGHAHVKYCLLAPVHWNRDSSRLPQVLLAAIADGYAETLHADDGYAGILARNPMARPHRGRARTQWLRREGFSLEELAEPLGGLSSLRPPSIATARTAEGRNSTCFELSMRWAGSPKHLGQPVRPVALGINAQFSHPMGLPEVGHIVKSVEGYRDKWIAEGKFHGHSPEQQRARGVRSGASRRALTAERDAQIVQARMTTGATHRQLAEEFGLNHRTVGRIIKRSYGL